MTRAPDIAEPRQAAPPPRRRLLDGLPRGGVPADGSRHRFGFTNRDLVSEFNSQTLPPAVKSAVLLILGTLFDNESDVQVGRTATQLPLTAEKLLLPWRIHPYGGTDAKDSVTVSDTNDTSHTL